MNVDDIEIKFGLTPGEAAALLGLDRRRYWEFASGRRELPPYLEASIRAHLAAKKSEVLKWIK